MDVLAVDMWEPFEKTEIIQDPVTKRLIERKTKDYRQRKAYKIVIQSDDGKREELLMERYKEWLPEKPKDAPAADKPAPAPGEGDQPAPPPAAAPFGGRLED